MFKLLLLSTPSFLHSSFHALTQSANHSLPAVSLSPHQDQAAKHPGAGRSGSEEEIHWPYLFGKVQLGEPGECQGCPLKGGSQEIGQELWKSRMGSRSGVCLCCLRCLGTVAGLDSEANDEVEASH